MWLGEAASLDNALIMPKFNNKTCGQAVTLIQFLNKWKNSVCAQLLVCGVAVFAFLLLTAIPFSCSSFISGIYFGYQNQRNTMELQFVPSGIFKSVLYNILYVVLRLTDSPIHDSLENQNSGQKALWRCRIWSCVVFWTKCKTQYWSQKGDGENVGQSELCLFSILGNWCN